MRAPFPPLNFQPPYGFRARGAARRVDSSRIYTSRKREMNNRTRGQSVSLNMHYIPARSKGARLPGDLFRRASHEAPVWPALLGILVFLWRGAISITTTRASTWRIRRSFFSSYSFYFFFFLSSTARLRLTDCAPLPYFPSAIPFVIPWICCDAAGEEFKMRAPLSSVWIRFLDLSASFMHYDAMRVVNVKKGKNIVD